MILTVKILMVKLFYEYISLANRKLYTAPDNDELEKKIDQVDQTFAKGKISLKIKFGVNFSGIFQ
jgi:hypothetical protein